MGIVVYLFPFNIITCKCFYSTNNSKEFYPPASLYKYDVEMLDEEKDSSEKMIICSNQIKRKKFSFSKDKLKLFMKQYVEINKEGVWCIKSSALTDFKIKNMKFKQIFDGPLPNFEISAAKKVKQETLIKYLTKNNTNASPQTNSNSKTVNKTAEQKQKDKEKEMEIDMARLLKEWYKPKEDLNLEDQKVHF